MLYIGIALGGALGAMSRYVLSIIIECRFKDSSFPFAIMIINSVGSFGLGLFFAMYATFYPLAQTNDFWFLSVGTGFFGAFTTFSTFSMEALELYRRRPLLAFVYVALTIGLSLTCFIVGYGWAGLR